MIKISNFCLSKVSSIGSGIVSKTYQGQINMSKCLLKTILRTYYSLPNWSPIANAFNKIHSPKQHIGQDVGLFNIPELTSSQGFLELKKECLLKIENILGEITNKRRTKKMVLLFDDLSDSLCRVADLSEFIRVSHPSSAYSVAAEHSGGALVEIVEKLNTNTDMYNVLKDVTQNGDNFPMDDVDTHVAKLFLFDFEQNGIHLPKHRRKKVVGLNNNILNLGQQFVSATFSNRIIRRDLLKADIRDCFPSSGDRAIISGLYSDSVNPKIRETAYKVFLLPDPKQETILSKLLEERYELAQICGFKTYAHRALKASTVDTPEMVMEFLNVLSVPLQPRALAEYEMMNEAKGSQDRSTLQPWDAPYLAKKAKSKWFEAEYSAYFSLGACMEGLNLLMQNLYGISLVNTDVSLGEIWSADVYKLSVVHETEGLLGLIYCDLYEREGKSCQDCHFTIRGGKVLEDGSYQSPIVVIVLNLAPPRWSTPSLLSPGMVDNLFHEMGHAMHSMLARTKYQHVTGTRCCVDFAEVPSVLMEYFSADERIIKTFAKHFQTGEPMPDSLIKRYCASKNLFSASEMQLQVFYAVLDQKYHGKHPLPGTTTEVLAETQLMYYGLPYVENTAWQLRFGHLFGYGAKYYSYLMSKAIASRIWQTYFQDDPLNRTQGEKYRRQFLAHGGGKPPKSLVKDFLQQEITPLYLAQSLIHDLDAKKFQLANLIGH